MRRLTGCYYCGRPIRGRAEVCGYCSDLPVRDPLVAKARQVLSEAERGQPMSADARDALRMSHMRLQQRCHDAEAHVERLLKANREQADRIAWLEGDVAGWRIKNQQLQADMDTQRRSLLDERVENQQLREALEWISTLPSRTTSIVSAPNIARAALDGTPSEDA